MKGLIAVCLVFAITVCPVFSYTSAEEPLTTADVVQEKTVVPLATTAIGEVAPMIVAIMSSSMDAGAKERTVLAIAELAKYQIEMKTKVQESGMSKIFDLSIKLISLGAAVFAAIKVTT